MSSPRTRPKPRGRASFSDSRLVFRCSLCAGRFRFRLVDHRKQLSCGLFDVRVLVLSGATFRGQYSAAVHFLEVTIRKLIPLLRLLWFLVVDCQMPVAVLAEALPLDEFVLLRCGRLIRAPRVTVVMYHFPLFHQFFRATECLLVEFQRHALTS